MNSDTADQVVPDRDHSAYIKMLDKVIVRLRAAIRARETARTGCWLPDRTFSDELIDVNCTPQGQEYDYGYHGPWDSLFEAWQATGAYLAEAMSSFDHKSE